MSTTSYRVVVTIPENGQGRAPRPFELTVWATCSIDAERQVKAMYGQHVWVSLQGSGEVEEAARRAKRDQEQREQARAAEAEMVRDADYRRRQDDLAVFYADKAQAQWQAQRAQRPALAQRVAALREDGIDMSLAAGFKDLIKVTVFCLKWAIKLGPTLIGVATWVYMSYLVFIV